MYDSLCYANLACEILFPEGMYTTPFLVALFVVAYRSTEIEQPCRKMDLV